MKFFKNLFLLIFLTVFLFSCSKEKKITVLQEKNLEDQMIELYEEGYEEFLILEGELIDSDGTIFKKGDFISYKPESGHYSHTKKGCLILTFMRGQNKQINKKKFYYDWNFGWNGNTSRS